MNKNTAEEKVMWNNNEEDIIFFKNKIHFFAQTLSQMEEIK